MIILLLKVTLMLGLGGTVAALLHRGSAAVRHLVWTLAIAGSLVLTLATPIAPDWTLRVGGWPAAPAARMEPARDPRTVSVTEADRNDRTTTVTERRDRYEPATTPITSRFDRFSVGQLVMGLWLFGAFAVLGRYLLGHLGLVPLQRRATPLASPAWTGLLGAVRKDYGVTRTVRLLSSRAVGSPVTWGTRRPVVLLPGDADSWSPERKRVVLAHELAHTARGDSVAQLIACAACVLYWFHPLMWLAARRLRSESERAADDLVLARDITPADYAAHLLEIAASARTLRLAGVAAIGMARRSHLEGRLLAVLDSTRSRRAPPARSQHAAWMGLLLLVIPFAALRPMASASAEAATASLRVPEAGEPRSDGRGTTLTTSAEVSPVATTTKAERAWQKSDSTFELTHLAAPGEALEIDLEGGGDVHVQGWDEPEVRVRASLGGINWRDTRVELVPTRAGVRLHSWQAVKRSSSSTDHRFEIRVPRRFNVLIKSGGGVLTIQDLEGEFRGSTGGGGFVIERASGIAELSTGGGNIRVSDVNLDGTVSTGGGTVTLSGVRGGLQGTSGSGPVISIGKATATGSLEHITIDPKKGNIRVGSTEVDGEMLRVRKAGGAIIIEGAPHGAELETGGGEIRVGPSTGQVRARTGGGDITIGPVAGSVHAGTGAGDVRVTVTKVRDEEQTVEIHAGVGNVVLELPPGFEGRLDLETAYTRKFGRRTRIETDWDLQEVESDDWDSTEGTPRKYVRAIGRVGSGDGLVRVKVVNGDITIRRR